MDLFKKQQKQAHDNEHLHRRKWPWSGRKDAGLQAESNPSNIKGKNQEVDRQQHTHGKSPDSRPAKLVEAPQRPRANASEGQSLTSLWDRAYNSLKDKKKTLVTEYEELLSKELTPDVNTPDQISKDPMSNPFNYNNEKPSEMANKVEQSNPQRRRLQMNGMIEAGRLRMEEKKIKYALGSKDRILEDDIATAVNLVLSVKDWIGEATKASPEASLIWAGVSAVLPFLTNPSTSSKANSGGFSYVTSRLRYYVALEKLLLRDNQNTHISSDLRREFEQHIEDLYQHILEFQLRSIVRFYRARFGNLGRDMFQLDDWNNMVSTIKDLEGIVNRDSNTINTAASLAELSVIGKSTGEMLNRMNEQLSVAKDQRDLASKLLNVTKKQLLASKEIVNFTATKDDETKNAQCLRDLRSTDPRLDKVRIEEDKDDLLEGSYIWILENPAFSDWRNNDDTRLLWIKGDPGKGKTMLMIGLIKELSKQLESSPGSGILSYFFCQDTLPTLNNAVSVLRGLIYLLVDQQKTLIRHLRKMYDSSGRQLFEDSNAFQALSEILSNMLHDSSLARVYLMVDALDECSSNLSQLLDLIARNISSPSRVKWLVSSRNRPDIAQGLRPRSHCNQISLESSSSHILHVINAFIDFKVQELAERNDYNSELRKEVGDHLRKNAEGTFLWVALVCKELRQVVAWDTQSALERLPPRLEPLYERMMDQIQQKKDANTVQLCKLILSLVTLAFRPLHLGELGAAANFPKRLSTNQQWLIQLVELCGSFLTVREETIYFVHQSAKDYFTTGKGAQIFPLGQKQAHVDLADNCIRLMSDKLQRNICNLQSPGALAEEVHSDHIKQHLHAEVQYACQYWVQHLQRSETQLPDNGQVHLFLQEHLLYWLEALSLMGKTSKGVLAVISLESLVIADQSPSLYAFIYDAKRFVLNNRSIIENAPLQLYHSALVFAPEMSLVRKQFTKEIPGWITRLPKMQQEWNSLLQTLEGHSSWVCAVAFSPDGKLVASASADETIRLWDSTTGGPLQTLEGHSGEVWAVAFSPDGKLVASASEDKTIKLWDMATGASLQTLKGHSGRVAAVAFSPDGKLVASASSDKTVRLWDSTTGAPLQTLEGHSGKVWTVAFSPNGRLTTSASDDKTIRLWNTATGASLQTLEGHSGVVWDVAFSPDGNLVASASEDKTIRLWDMATGASLQTLKGHSNGVSAVAFSPDGKLVTSGDDTIKLWDSTTGASLQTLEGHFGLVWAVAFSPDGKLVASASIDKTVRLWDSTTGASLRTLEGHSDGVSAVAFLPNGKLVASASRDETIKLWDTATGASLQTLETAGAFKRQSFSNVGQYLDTDRGQLVIGSYFASAIPLRSNSARERKIFVDDTWVLQDTEKVLWLPSDYRAIACAFRNNVLVMGHISGRVSILEFDVT